MAIVKMNKFSLLAFHEHRDELLRELQKFEDVHFRDLRQDEAEEGYDFLPVDSSSELVDRYEAMLEQVDAALERLKVYAPKTKTLPKMSMAEFEAYLDTYDYAGVCTRVDELSTALAFAQEETERLHVENATLTLWKGLDIAPAELDSFVSAGYLLGTVPSSTKDALREQLQTRYDTLHVEFLGELGGDEAALLLMPGDLVKQVFSDARDLGFVRVDLAFSGVPVEVLAENKKTLEELPAKVAETQAALEKIGVEFQNLQVAQDCINTLLIREHAKENFMQTEQTSVLEGWVPASRTAELQRIVTDVCGESGVLDITEVAQDNPDVPTKLKNNRFVTAFESITMMYSTPAYHELDPTPVMSVFFPVFFAFMLGDVAYGLLAILFATFMLSKNTLKESMRQFMRLFRYLGIATLFSGAIYGSFFGYDLIHLAPDGMGGRKALISTSDNIAEMLIFSIAFGFVHLLVGQIMLALNKAHSKDYSGIILDAGVNLLVLIGLVMWLLGSAVFSGPWGNIGKWMTIIGSVGTFVFSARDSASLGGRIGGGVYNLYGSVSGVISDLVSYTRIAALGLSGAYIAFAFNLIVDMIPGGIGWIAKIAVFLIGHGLNIGLALLGGYVHTARLQYVEFYGKFFTGGGKNYRPLTLQRNNVLINK